MKVIRSVSSLSQPLGKSLVTLGNFDGVHLGHQQLIKALMQYRTVGGSEPIVVMTFDPHPMQVLSPNTPFSRLSDAEDLEFVLRELGVDYLLIEPFTKSLAALSPEVFLQNYIFQPLSPRCLVVGYDFSFGKDRTGQFDLIRKMCDEKGIASQRVEPLCVGGEVVSSRGIREQVRCGDLKKAKTWLGRNFSLNGLVVHGAGRGQQIGFSTLNLEPTITTLPQIGVYASRAVVGGKTYSSVTNIGSSPTFVGDGRVKIETHVLDANLNVYGEKVKIEFVERLRDEIKFSSVEQLKEQIAKDIQRAREVL